MRMSDCISRLRSAALAVVLMLLAPHAAAAAEFPVKPVRWLLPFSPGGGTDITARRIGAKLNEYWKQAVVVDNRPGATGNIALETAAHALPDGYTILLISASISINPALRKNLPYDLVRDFAPITQMTSQPYILCVHPSVAARSVSELIAASKARKDGYTFGSSGTGGLSHLSGALLEMLGGANLVHIPYKGGGPLLTDLVAGQINVGFPTPLEGIPHIKSGRIRALGVTTLKRSTALPELPTIAEAGVAGYEVNGWYGVLAPAATPAAILGKLNHDINRALKSPDIVELFARDGVDLVGTSREAFGAHVRAEVEKWKRIVPRAGIKVD